MLGRLVFFTILVVILVACNALPLWKIADQGEACINAIILEKEWFDNSTSGFAILVKADSGQIGVVYTNAYEYSKFEIGDNTCIIP